MTATGIEEGGSKVVIFGCGQSIGTYNKELPLGP